MFSDWFVAIATELVGGATQNLQLTQPDGKEQ